MSENRFIPIIENSYQAYNLFERMLYHTENQQLGQRRCNSLSITASSYQESMKVEDFIS